MVLSAICLPGRAVVLSPLTCAKRRRRAWQQMAGATAECGGSNRGHLPPAEDGGGWRWLHRTRLLKLAEERAASWGFAGTRLYTNKLFVSNIRLYEALGYRVQREEEHNGGVAVHMMKSRVRPLGSAASGFTRNRHTKFLIGW